MSRKICVVTGTRAEYGLLRWIIIGLRDRTDLELQLVTTGMHLSPEFGLTYQEIENDGIRIDAKVEMLVSSDTPVGVTKSIGLGTIGFADAFATLKPDLVVVLGDRFEILAAAQAAFLAGICIAHISGGEVTEGSQDDTIRHCITKMARYHFVAADEYRRRVIQLGEQPDCVFNVGDPGLDNIERLTVLTRDELGARLGFDAHKPFFLVTYHPATAGESDPAQAMQCVFDALEEFAQFQVLITKSNADVGGRLINATIDAYTLAHSGRVIAATSLGQMHYINAMRQCVAVVGNSSSGIIEAPVLRIPTVNIGNRQHGRLKATSVIDCDENCASIAEALKRAVSPEFRRTAMRTESLYGHCNASTAIVERLSEVDIDRRHAKRFYDLPA